MRDAFRKKIVQRNTFFGWQGSQNTGAATRSYFSSVQGVSIT